MEDVKNSDTRIKVDILLRSFAFRCSPLCRSLSPTMSLNCTAETNLIDSNTVSIKYIIGGWLTLLFCVSGKERRRARVFSSSSSLEKGRKLRFVCFSRHHYEYFYGRCSSSSSDEEQFDTCLSNGSFTLQYFPARRSDHQLLDQIHR